MNDKLKSIHKSHHDIHNAEIASHMEQEMEHRFFISLSLAIPIFLIATWPRILDGRFSPFIVNLILLILSTPCVFWTGSLFLTGAYHSLKSRTLNMSVLIATAVLVAYGASIFLLIAGAHETFFEAPAMLVTFVLFGHWMEMKARRGTTDALKALFQLIPSIAIVRQDGQEVTINVSALRVGDIVILKPGEKVPIDGQIIKGQTTIDESMVTGESRPVIKNVGDVVVGGSINQMGAIEFKVTHAQNETTLATIIKMVEKAQRSKASGQQLADKAAAVLVIIALSAGVTTFLSWALFSQVSLIAALSFGVSAIVIACPDALGLATPTVIAVGTGIGALHNILIKDADSLEKASKIEVVLLDKTGTLTEGKPTIESIIALKPRSDNEVLYYAASVQALASHPVTEALLKQAQEKNIILSQNIEHFKAIGGVGVQARVDGKEVIVGTAQLLESEGIATTDLIKMISHWLAVGKSISFVAVDKKIIGAFAATDQLKKNAKRTIESLKAMHIDVVMVTGDNKSIAAVIAHELGIERFFAEILPDQKSEYVKKLQAESHFVAMVGDGINDAPALAQANIGIAIGSGTDVARETASIILMKSDPLDIVNIIILSKATVRKMKQNLFWAAGYNLLMIPLAAGALYPHFGWSLSPEVSALLMSMSSITVALNAVSLKYVVRFKK